MALRPYPKRLGRKPVALRHSLSRGLPLSSFRFLYIQFGRKQKSLTPRENLGRNTTRDSFPLTDLLQQQTGVASPAESRLFSYSVVSVQPGRMRPAAIGSEITQPEQTPVGSKDFVGWSVKITTAETQRSSAPAQGQSVGLRVEHTIPSANVPIALVVFDTNNYPSQTLA